METELEKYKYYSWSIKSCLVVSGLWPDQRPVILKKILSLISFLTTSVILLSVTNFCFHNVTNVMILTRGTGVAISFFSVLAKAYLFLLHDDDLTYLNNFLTLRYLRDLKNKENHSYLLKGIDSFYLLLIIYFTLVARIMFFYVFTPILILQKHGKYVHAYPVVYPFSYEPGGFVHWTLYLIESLGSFSILATTVGVDSVFGLYTFQMCGSFRILTKKFQDLRIDQDYENNLKECIQRHQILMNMKYKLESIFGLIVIWQALSGAFSLCSLIFQISKITENQVTFATTSHYMLYFIPKFLQIFTYAWFGDLITNESSACSESIYFSHWPDNCNLKFRKTIMIVLTQRPLFLVAKGIIRIQLDLFTKIVKMSMSYFYLLQTINDADSNT